MNNAAGREHACREQLIELLNAHNSRIGAANEYLLEIKTAIAENRLDRLQQSVANPLAMQDSEALEQQRHALLDRCGFDQDQGGFENCIQWCDDDAASLSDLYQQLIQNLVRLQHSIQVNCLLVNKGQDRVRRSIGILTGHATSGAAKTYSSDGKASDPAGRRDIAIA